MVRDLWCADRLDVRLRQGRLGVEHLAAAAAKLATVHAGAGGERATEESSAEALARRVRGLGAAIERSGGDARPLVERALRAIEAERERIAARARGGRVARVRGTIGLANLYVDSRLRALIDPPAHAALQAADVAEDVARTTVALTAAGRRDLAERWVAHYAEASDDFDLYRLLALHEAVAVLANAAEAAANGSGQEAGRLLEAAAASFPAGRPRLVGVCGPRASGVTTVARRLAADIGAPVVSADTVRATEAPSGGWPLYLALARRAEAVLDSGRSVVLDGGLGSRAARRAAVRLARERGVPLLFTECRADEAIRLRRLASLPIVPTACEDDWEPVEDLAGADHVVIDTGRAIARSLARLRRALPASRPLVA